mmetsp:Transcript_19957/g.25907  ORF Transcript_19957/g.25907 Transcript_19957/m.25907 type:complete len:135 (+) Transcript_19957:163-567(+)
MKVGEYSTRVEYSLYFFLLLYTVGFVFAVIQSNQLAVDVFVVIGVFMLVIVCFAVGCCTVKDEPLAVRKRSERTKFTSEELPPSYLQRRSNRYDRRPFYMSLKEEKEFDVLVGMIKPKRKRQAFHQRSWDYSSF